MVLELVGDFEEASKYEQKEINVADATDMKDAE